uniref:MD-2-related lipid-recognition domain-containing protein n=1 Tax=Anopheles atroparvus TaxID=41427 RepID=A0A182J4R1_ANOAO
MIKRVFVDIIIYSQYLHTRSYLFGTTFECCDFRADSASRTNSVHRLTYGVAERNGRGRLSVHMIRNLVALLVIVITLGVMEGLARTPKPFWMKRFECTGQPYKYTTVFSCHVENQRDKPQRLQISVNITELLTKLFISIELYAKHRQSQTLMYGTTFEYCEFMKNKESQSNPVAAIMYNYAKHNYPHILIPCPITGMFNISNQLDRNMIPPFVTPGSYIATHRFYTKRNETVLDYIADFSIAAPSIFNKTMTMFNFK